MDPSLIAQNPLRNKLIPLVALLLLLLASIYPADAQTGVCYGTQGNDLPSPQDTLSLFKQINIRRVRIYSPNQKILQALAGTGIQLMLDTSNAALQGLAASQSNAAAWVQSNVLAHPDVAFRYIVVGNEVRPNNENSQLAQFLLPALQNVQAAVAQAGLGARVKVSTAFDFGVIGNSYPPSAGKFDNTISSFLNPIVRFVASNGAPLMMNIYPYFAYADVSSGIHLDYALFTAHGTVVTDGGFQYQNLFDAMVDAVHSALEKAGAASVAVVVSETGWPTMGGRDTTIDNARAYNNNLIRSVKGGTPKRGGELETYIFAMYNENQKTPELEKHWGLYSSTPKSKYPINF